MEEQIKALSAMALKPRNGDKIDPITKLFAQAVDVAIDQDYVELWDVCNAFGLPHPYGYSDDDDERAQQECDAIWKRLDEEFEKFFGMTREQSRII